MCRKSLCHKRQPNSSGTFFMPSEQQPFPDFIENQKKDVTGILIISGQSTSTVSNSIRHAILSKKYTERVKRNWNTQTPHRFQDVFFQAHSGRAIRHADGISKGIHLHHPPGIPCLLYPMIDFIERNPAPFSPNAFVPIPYAARYNHIDACPMGQLQ